MTKFRTKKDASGKIIHYPVDRRSPGMTHSAAATLERRLRNAYPDERITLIKVGSGKNKLYAPSIAYLTERMRKAFPLEGRSDLAALVPLETYKLLDTQKNPSEPIYVLFFSEDGDGLTVFGQGTNGSFNYAIDWHGIDTNNGGEILRITKDHTESMEKPGDMPTPMEIKDRISQDINKIMRESALIVRMGSYEAESADEMLSRIPDSTPVEISYKNGQITIFPLENSSDVVTFFANTIRDSDGPVSGYYRADALRSLIHAYALSENTTPMELSIGNTKSDSVLMGRFPVAEKLKGFSGGVGVPFKYAGNFTGIVSPFSAKNIEDFSPFGSPSSNS